MAINWGGGCNPKKPYPILTFSRVGVGFFWVLLGFFGFFWVFKKLIIFADFLYTQCENMHMLQHKYTNDEVNTTFVNIEKKLPGCPENF